ncbi:methyltransferase domain-containing protein [Candidatus Shapirobacteria bacterium]|nr:methyltransferase domain-containing protein [Candidatus Shapirobacteria bacterium]
MIKLTHQQQVLAGYIYKEFVLKEARENDVPFIDYDQQFPIIDWWALAGAKLLTKLNQSQVDNSDISSVWKNRVVLDECPVCGHTMSLKKLKYIGISSIENCQNCGHGFQNPQLSLPYSVTPFPTLMSDSAITIGGRKPKIVETIDYIESCLKDKDSWNEQETLIDVGCGKGDLIQLLLDRGYPGTIYGCDTDINAIKIAKDKVQGSDKVSLICGTFEDLIRIKKLGRTNIGTFVLSKSLEHLPKPKQIISQMLNLLKQSGVVIILEIPNHDPKSIISSLLEDKTGYNYFPDHLHFFTVNSLRILAKSIFAEIKIDRVGHLTEKEPVITEIGARGWFGKTEWVGGEMAVNNPNFCNSYQLNISHIKKFFKLHNLNIPPKIGSFEKFFDLFKKTDITGSALLNAVITKT